MGTLRRLIIFLGMLFGTAAGAPADVLVLTDGRLIEGRILGRTGDTVQIDAMISSIRVRTEFRRDEIAEIIERPLPPSFFDPPAPPVRPPAREPTPRWYYMAVPIEGEIGVEFTAEGLAEALGFARRQRIPNIVFQVRAGGVDSAEAHRLLDVLIEFEEAFRYECELTEAVGAAAVFPAMADAVWTVEGARLAADPSLDAAAARSLNDRLAPFEGRALPRALVAALLVSPLGLWLEEGDAEAPARLLNGEPASGSHLLKSPGDSAISFPAPALIAYAAARPISETASVSIPRTSASNYGVAAMGQDRERLRQREKDVERAALIFATLDSILSEAERTPLPGQFTDYSYHTHQWRDECGVWHTEERMTLESRLLWDRRLDAYRDVWRSVRDSADRLVDLCNKHAGYGDLPHYVARATAVRAQARLALQRE